MPHWKDGTVPSKRILGREINGFMVLAYQMPGILSPLCRGCFPIPTVGISQRAAPPPSFRGYFSTVILNRGQTALPRRCLLRPGPFDYYKLGAGTSM